MSKLGGAEYEILTLKITRLSLFVAGECDFSHLVAEKLLDLLVFDGTDLIIRSNQVTVLVTNTSAIGFSHSIADRIFCTDVAVDTAPTVIAVAFVAFAHWPIFATGKRSTNYERMLAY